MSAQVIKIDPKAKKKLDEVLANLGAAGKAEVWAYLERVFTDRFGPAAGRHVQETQLTAGKAAPAYKKQERLHGRTYALRASIRGKGLRFQGAPAIGVGTYEARDRAILAYAWAQEFGTKFYNPESPVDDITPQKAKAMTVPPGWGPPSPAGYPPYTVGDFAPGELSAVYFSGRGGPHRNIIGKLVLTEELRRARAAAAASGTSVDYTQIDTVFLLFIFVRLKAHYFLLDGLIDYLPIMAKQMVKDLGERFLGKKELR